MIFSSKMLYLSIRPTFSQKPRPLPRSSRSFNYPTQADILTVPFVDILTTVEISTSNGKSYNHIKEEQVKPSKID